jgi:hypothetical protein
MNVMTDDARGAAVSLPWLGKNDDGAVLRLLIAGAVLVAIAWIVVVALVRPGSFWLEAMLRFVPVLLALAAVSAFTVSLLGLVRRSSEPPRFVVRKGVAFVVPTSRAFGYFVVGEVLMLGFFAGSAIFQWSHPVGGDAGFAVISYALTGVLSVLSVALGGLVAPMVVTALGGRPRVELTSRAMVVREPLGSRTIPWEALRPGLPTRVGSSQTVTLTVDRPELVVRTGLTWRSPQVAMAYLRVPPSFLADAIRHYVDHPDRRDAVGLWAEHERLLVDLDVSAGR